VLDPEVFIARMNLRGAGEREDGLETDAKLPDLLRIVCLGTPQDVANSLDISRVKSTGTVVAKL
jgi:hypothetical protein